MPREDGANKTDLIWKIDFTKYGDTVDHDPRNTIIPPLRTIPDSAGREALHVLQSLYADISPRLQGQLELGTTIGSGGIGEVISARQVALERTVAVKKLKPSKRSDAAIMDLLHEAWVTGSLEHPNVVPVYDLVLDERGSPLIVFKRIEGLPWNELIDDRARVRDLFGAESLLEWNLGILMQVLNAVRFAHDRGIVHRDLKPANVMIGEFGEVYLVDWGLAVSTADDGSGRLPLARDATALAGTLCYMAPEMLGDADPGSNLTISERTDIYLSGAILYEILVGQPPHTGKNSMAIVTSVVLSDPDIPDHVPPRLARICRRAMDPDPDGRFENAEQVRLAIQGFMQHRGSERLAAKAQATLSELHAMLDDGRSTEPMLGRPGTPGPGKPWSGESSSDRSPADEPWTGDPDDADYRQRLYKLFGACRFGFREALATWHGNDAARDGLQLATLAMIEYELAQGDPRAAAALCAELAEPPAELSERIDGALAQQNAEKQRSAKLEELGLQLDFSTGQRSRASVVAILGVCFTLVPALFVWRFEELVFRSHAQLTMWNGFFLAVAVVIGIFWRKSLRQSAINRRLYSLLLLLLFVQIPLELGLWQAGLTPFQSILIHVFLWFFLAAVIAVTYDRRLIPGALAYLVVFLIIATIPDIALVVVHAPHAVITVNAVWVWRAR